jgi:hypothetical protein
LTVLIHINKFDELFYLGAKHVDVHIFELKTKINKYILNESLRRAWGNTGPKLSMFRFGDEFGFLTRES